MRRRLIAALAQAGFRVLEGGDETPPNVIQISHFQPFRKAKWRERWYRRDGVHRAILYTTFESTRLPDDYVEAAKDFDAIWTTSEWCRNVFVRAFEGAGFSKPVFVVRHGVDSGQFPPILRHPKKPSDLNPYTFLWKGQNPSDRKRGDIAIEAFKMANLPHSRLLVKSQPGHHSRGTFFNVDRVTYTSEWWTDDELRLALANADCFVQPTRGEGFGLEPLEATACALPAMATAYSGIEDYLWDCGSIWAENYIDLMELDDGTYRKPGEYISTAMLYPLPNTIGKAFYTDEAERVRGMLISGKIKKASGWLDLDFDYGEDAHVSPEDLAHAMTYVYENQEQVLKLARYASAHVHKHWTWHHGALDVAKALEAMGWLEEVSWFRRDGWLEDIRRLRNGGDIRGPLAFGREPKVDDSLIIDIEGGII